MSTFNQQQYFDNYHQTQSRYQSSKKPTEASREVAPFSLEDRFSFMDHQQPVRQYEQPNISQPYRDDPRRSRSMRNENINHERYRDPELDVHREKRIPYYAQPPDSYAHPDTNYQHRMPHNGQNYPQIDPNSRQRMMTENQNQLQYPVYPYPEDQFQHPMQRQPHFEMGYQMPQMMINQPIQPFNAPFQDHPHFQESPQARNPLSLSRFDDRRHYDEILRQEHPFRRVFQEDVISEALKDLALYERQIERFRVLLAGQPEFRINQLYQQLDDNGNKNIYGAELKKGLKQFDVVAQDQDIMLVILQYTTQKDHLSPQEFGRMLYPLTQHIQTRCGDQDSEQHSFTAETKQLIGKLFKMLLNTEIAAEFYRQEIKEKKIDLKAVFAFINESKTGTIGVNELKQFIYSKGFYIDPITMQGMKKYLSQLGLFRRFDKNNSGQVSFQEFNQQFIPKL